MSGSATRTNQQPLWLGNNLNSPLRLVRIRQIVDLDISSLAVDLNDVGTVLLLLLAVEWPAPNHHLDAIILPIGRHVN